VLIYINDMKVTRFTVQACCGKTSLIFKTDRPIDIKLLIFLKSNGFMEQEHFTQVGILDADSSELIVSGQIGSDRLQVRCKKENCSLLLNDFEVLLQQME
jgi:hypothetical protein